MTNYDFADGQVSKCVLHKPLFVTLVRNLGGSVANSHRESLGIFILTTF